MLVELLRGSSIQQAITPGRQEFYERCLEQLQETGLWLHVHQLLVREGQWDHTPLLFQATVLMKEHRITAQNLYVRHYFDKILSALAEGGVDVIPLKGLRFSERYYDHATARPTTDIDLLVRPEQVLESIRLIQNLGFEGPYRFDPRHFHCVLHKRDLAEFPCVVEIHWNIVKDYTSHMDLQDLWNCSIPDRVHSTVRFMSLNYEFYHICLHGANHNMDSLKYAVDVFQMIDKAGQGIDYAWLYDRAKRDRTLRRIQYVLHQVYEIFPKLHDRKPLGALESKRHCVFYDTWGDRMRVARDRVWPTADVARWFVQADDGLPDWKVHMLFLRRRLKRVSSFKYRNTGENHVGRDL